MLIQCEYQDFKGIYKQKLLNFLRNHTKMDLLICKFSDALITKK